MSNFIIDKERTAIATGNSKGATCIASQINKDSKILDYGAGRLRNALYLLDSGFKNVSVLDTKKQVEKWDKYKDKFKNIYTTEEIAYIKDKYEYILCSYVLNVIPEYDIRVDIINNISNLLELTGIAVIEVRGAKSLNNVKYKEVFNDGFICGNGKTRTFQKPYELEDIISFLNKESDLKVFRYKSTGDRIILFCCKDLIRLI